METNTDVPWRSRTLCTKPTAPKQRRCALNVDALEDAAAGDGDAVMPFTGTLHGIIGAERGTCMAGPRGVAVFPNPGYVSNKRPGSPGRHGSPGSPIRAGSPLGSPVSGGSLSRPASPSSPIGSPRPRTGMMNADTPTSPAAVLDQLSLIESPVLLAVTHGHCVDILDPVVGITGPALRQSIGTHGSAAGEFDEPRGIIALTKDPRRVLLVVVDTRNHRVQTVLPQTGATVQCIGRSGRGPKEFMFPHNVAELPNGNIVITDTMNHRVQVVDPTTGLFVGRFGSEGSDPGQLRRPKGIAVLADGMVAVADHGNNRVQVFNPETGAVVRCVGSNPHGAISPKHLLCPNGLAVLPDGRLLVCEEANHRLNVLDLGADTDPFVATVGRPGSHGLLFNFPFGVATMPNGLVVVADSGNHRLQLLQ